MSEDLVKELRFWNGGHKSDEKMAKAADRIEQLEAALREVLDCWDWWQVDTHDRCASVPSEAIREARAVLGGKKDD